MKLRNILLASLAVVAFSSAQSFAVDHKHEHGKSCDGKHGKKAKRMMKKMDTNKDGKVSLEEFKKGKEMRFKKMDTNSDGMLSEEEMSKCDCGKGHKKS